MVWLQLYSGLRKMQFLYSHAGHPWDPDRWGAAAPQGEATTTPAQPPSASCQSSQGLTSPLESQKAPGFLQGKKGPQHEFHHQNWSSFWLADKERSWFRGFPFQLHTWSIILEERIAIDVTLEQFYKWSFLSISFSRQRGMGRFYSSSFFYDSLPCHYTNKILSLQGAFLQWLKLWAFDLVPYHHYTTHTIAT